MLLCAQATIMDRPKLALMDRESEHPQGGRIPKKPEDEQLEKAWGQVSTAYSKLFAMKTWSEGMNGDALESASDQQDFSSCLTEDA